MSSNTTRLAPKDRKAFFDAQIRAKTLKRRGVRLSVSALDVLVEDFKFHPPRGLARRFAHDRPRASDDAYLASLLGTSPGYWLRMAKEGPSYRNVWDALEDTPTRLYNE
ncbi:hypothetical protein ACT3R7_11935 [Halomonas sp. AOP43-A1-21]